MHNETLSVAAMNVCNPDHSTVGIYRRNTAPGFAEIVSDWFPSASCDALLTEHSEPFAVPTCSFKLLSSVVRIIPAELPKAMLFLLVV